MSDEQQPPATEAKPDAKPDAKPARRWPAPEVWLLGALGVFGLAGFVLAFVLVMQRTTPNPQAATAAVQAPGA